MVWTPLLAMYIHIRDWLLFLGAHAVVRLPNARELCVWE